MISRFKMYKTRSQEFEIWRRNTETDLKYIFGDQSQNFKNFNQISYDS